MAPGRDRIVDGSVTRQATLALAVLALLSACPRTGDGAPGTLDPPAPDGSGRVLRVGNPSRGVDEQPDYDRSALELRARVQGRIPESPPPVRDACNAMLDAAAAMYGRTEASADGSVDGSAQVQRLQATRERDLAACEAETSPQAAVCVALLLAEEAGEWPWLLDQCTRAFPRA
jgi:hypothetical protein